MSGYAIHFFGFDLERTLSAIEDHIQTKDPEFLGGEDLGTYIGNSDFGDSLYDGNGDGDIVYIGVKVPKQAKGFVVTEEIEAKTTALLAELPDPLASAIKAVIGDKEPAFHMRLGWN